MPSVVSSLVSKKETYSKEFTNLVRNERTREKIRMEGYRMVMRCLGEYDK